MNGSRHDELEIVAGHVELLGREPVYLLELSAREPEPALVSVVLDLRNPFRSTQRVVDGVSKLVRRLPSTWRLLLYQLGRYEPLAGSSLAALFDGNLDLARLADEQLIEAREKGSFLRPCIESISSQLESESERSAIVFLVTNGDLTDFGQVEFPNSIKVIGVAHEKSDPSRWADVLPQSELLDVQDHGLDNSIREFVYPFFGLSVLQVNGLVAAEGQVFRFFPDRRYEPWDITQQLEVNFARENALIVFSLPLSELQDMEIRIKVADGVDSETIRVPNWNSVFPVELEARINSIFLESNAQDALEVVFDVGQSDGTYQEIRGELESALQLALRRESWISKKMVTVFANQICRGKGRDTGSLSHDALICFFQQKEGEANPKRIIGIGLNRHRHPAAKLAFGVLPDFPIQSNFDIEYQAECYRWKLVAENRVLYELDSYNSEVVQRVFPLGADWHVVFSGDLKC